MNYLSCHVKKKKEPIVINDAVFTGATTVDGYSVLFLTYFCVLLTTGQMDEGRITEVILSIHPDKSSVDRLKLLLRIVNRV